MRLLAIELFFLPGTQRLVSPFSYPKLANISVHQRFTNVSP